MLMNGPATHACRQAPIHEEKIQSEATVPSESAILDYLSRQR
jgi:hypothetical protein